MEREREREREREKKRGKRGCSKFMTMERKKFGYRERKKDNRLFKAIFLNGTRQPQSFLIYHVFI